MAIATTMGKFLMRTTTTTSFFVAFLLLVVVLWNQGLSSNQQSWQGSGVVAFAPTRLSPSSSSSPSSCRSRPAVIAINNNVPDGYNPHRYSVSGRCISVLYARSRNKFLNFERGDRKKGKIQLNVRDNVDDVDDDDDDDESFDVYSRDMRDQIRIESSQYKVIDGSDNNDYDDDGDHSILKTIGKRTLRTMGRVFSRPPKPGKLILLRCGQSVWNANGTFTGWADPDLTDQGIQECQHAAALLLAEGYQPDLVYTSRLKRSIRSARIVLHELQSLFLPVQKSWRLNERCYGALTGLSKSDTALTMGASVVQAWRNSLKARPPPMSRDDPHFPGNDRRYADLSLGQIPLTESLLDTMKRTRPLYEYQIKRDLMGGNTVLVVAHGNTLRGLIKVIDDISDQDIQHVTIPAGIPVVYNFDRTMHPLPSGKRLSQEHTNAVFLEKPGLLQEALQKQNLRKQKVPGLSEGNFQQYVSRDRSLVAALQRLREEQSTEISVAGGGTKRNDHPRGHRSSEDQPNLQQQFRAHERWDDDPSEFEDWDEFGLDSFDEPAIPIFNRVTITLKEGDGGTEGATRNTAIGIQQNERLTKDPVVVFIRHGRTPHNNLGLFTGWEDPPLAPEGIEDARRAGRILKHHGFEFDVVYTSWLTRAIETASLVLDELDCIWVTVVKSWRLNERMYGALTGKSKAMIANEYGENQLKKWRRGFKIRPPPVSSYSLSYPGNDFRRIKYVKDLRISWSETFNRSFESRKLEIHRKFPKSESLHDCMQRSIPFYTERITSEAIKKGKRVLIASHENAIRGILMHLCDIPEEAMNQLHIPNCVPLVYDVKAKCITLLDDDGQIATPVDLHDFGPAAKYLFKACELPETFYVDNTEGGDLDSDKENDANTAVGKPAVEAPVSNVRMPTP